MDERAARAEAERRGREDPTRVWAPRARDDGSWEVVAVSLPGGRIRPEHGTAIQPPPPRPTPQQDPRPPVRPEWYGGGG